MTSAEHKEIKWEVLRAPSSSNSSTPTAHTTTPPPTKRTQDGSSYVGEVLANGQFHGQGKMEWKTGVDAGNSYNGSWKCDVIDGQGTYVWSDGRQYKGQFVQGLFEGVGEHTWPEGTIYTGEWKRGKSDGRGSKKWGKGQLKGCEYDGEWVQGAIHGSGTFKWADGNQYRGSWHQGKRMGEGDMTFAGVDGGQAGRFEGGWLDDRMHGSGTYWWANGNTYKGDWQNGARNGTGKLVFGKDHPNTGDTYDGSWVDNQMSGFGVYEFKDGGRYEGHWRAGKRHGQGTRLWPNGHRYSGAWVDDVVSGSGTYIWEEGTVYDGQWMGGQCHGQGRKMWTSGVSAGNVYAGSWAMGRMEGDGVYTWQDGSLYSGHWQRGRCQGQGTMQWSNGDKYEGEWEDDVMHGTGQFVEARTGNIYKGGYHLGKRHGLATHLYAKYGQEWEEEWEHGFRKTQIRCIMGDQSTPLPVTEDGSFDMTHIHATVRSLEDSVEQNRSAGESAAPRPTDNGTGLAGASAAPADGGGDAAPETDLDAPVDADAAADVEVPTGRRKASINHTGRQSVGTCFDNHVKKDARSRTKNTFTTITEEKTQRSLGFVMFRPGMALKDVRFKIADQFGSLVPRFSFVRDREAIAMDQESTVLVVPQFAPVCIVRLE